MEDHICDVKSSIIVAVAANELRGRWISTATEVIGGIENATGREADPDATDLKSGQ
jgi:hypothetical protein